MNSEILTICNAILLAIIIFIGIIFLDVGYKPSNSDLMHEQDVLCANGKGYKLYESGHIKPVKETCTVS